LHALADHSKNVNRTRTRRQFIIFLIATAIVVLALFLIYKLDEPVRGLLISRMGLVDTQAKMVVAVLRLVFFAILAYLAVRALNAFIFGRLFRFLR